MNQCFQEETTKDDASRRGNHNECKIKQQIEAQQKQSKTNQALILSKKS